MVDLETFEEFPSPTWKSCLERAQSRAKTRVAEEVNHANMQHCYASRVVWKNNISKPEHALVEGKIEIVNPRRNCWQLLDSVKSKLQKILLVLALLSASEAFAAKASKELMRLEFVVK